MVGGTTIKTELNDDVCVCQYENSAASPEHRGLLRGRAGEESPDAVEQKIPQGTAHLLSNRRPCFLHSSLAHSPPPPPLPQVRKEPSASAAAASAPADSPQPPEALAAAEDGEGSPEGNADQQAAGGVEAKGASSSQEPPPAGGDGVCG